MNIDIENKIKNIKLEKVYRAVIFNYNVSLASNNHENIVYSSSHVEFASKNRGYSIGDNEINDSVVKRRFNKILIHINSHNYDNVEFVNINNKTGYLGIEKNNKITLCYFIREDRNRCQEN